MTAPTSSPELLARVAACPDRGGVLPLYRQAEGCGGGERSECRAARGPACRRHAVTLAECLRCRAELGAMTLI